MLTSASPNSTPRPEARLDLPSPSSSSPTPPPPPPLAPRTPAPTAPPPKADEPPASRPLLSSEPGSDDAGSRRPDEPDASSGENSASGTPSASPPLPHPAALGVGLRDASARGDPLGAAPGDAPRDAAGAADGVGGADGVDWGRGLDPSPPPARASRQSRPRGPLSHAVQRESPAPAHEMQPRVQARQVLLSGLT